MTSTPRRHAKGKINELMKGGREGQKDGLIKVWRDGRRGGNRNGQRHIVPERPHIRAFVS